MKTLQQLMKEFKEQAKETNDVIQELGALVDKQGLDELAEITSQLEDEFAFLDSLYESNGKPKKGGTKFEYDPNKGYAVYPLYESNVNFEYGVYDSAPTTYKNYDNQTNKEVGVKPLSLSKVKTQKARGIAWLQSGGNPIPHYKGQSRSVQVLAHKFFKASDDPQLITDNYVPHFPVFVRPCPVVPRHGFVDSRVVSNGKQLANVFKETLDVEPDAEVCFTQPVSNPVCSAILNGNHFVVGASNDGATSGSQGCIKLPVVRKTIPAPPKHVVAEGQGDYWEFVLNNSSVAVVQVRSGPKMEVSMPDFIPETVEVKQVLGTGGDLLEWEQKIANAPEGLVVRGQPNSMSSHFGVHCYIHGVPYITTFDPEVGQVLEKNIDKKPELDIEELQQGFFEAVNQLTMSGTNVGQLRNYIITTLYATHNLPEILQSDMPGRMIGRIIGAFWKTCVAVACGESRFQSPQQNVTNPFAEGSWSRGQVYKKIFNRKSLQTNLQDLKLASHSFKDASWGGSFGGKKWLNCSVATGEIFNALKNGSVTEFFTVLNNTLHSYHNGGYFLNKIIKSSQIDAAPEAPDAFTLCNLPEIYEVMTKLEALEEKPLTEKDLVTLDEEFELVPSPEKLKKMKAHVNKFKKVHADELSSSDEHVLHNLLEQIDADEHSDWLGEVRMSVETTLKDIEKIKVVAEMEPVMHNILKGYRVGHRYFSNGKLTTQTKMQMRNDIESFLRVHKASGTPTYKEIRSFCMDKVMEDVMGNLHFQIRHLKSPAARIQLKTQTQMHGLSEDAYTENNVSLDPKIWKHIATKENATCKSLYGSSKMYVPLTAKSSGLYTPTGVKVLDKEAMQNECNVFIAHRVTLPAFVELLAKRCENLSY